MNDQEDNSSVFRILVTNDNHVGFKEDDKIRKRDALATFEEILQIARNLKVDFVLHSGDLFDDARPNRFWMNSVMRLFRDHCFGDSGVEFSQLKTEYSKPANFEDPHMNIDMPVFMIHGNHDDAGGEFGDSKALSCADILETANLVTYFGKHDNVEEEINVAPILLRKGDCKIALYGLGNIRDERLHRMFVNKKVTFVAPTDSEYFNVMAIHQNRFRGNKGGVPSKSSIHNTFLPSFLNLVVWAHEHECIPSVEESLEGGFHILQSGSSVSTSLTSSEKMPKHVFLLEVSRIDGEHKFRITPVPLLTVRPLVLDEIVFLSNEGLVEKVEAMIAEGTENAKLRMQARCEWLTEAGNPRSLFPPIRPDLPLVRLKVFSPESLNQVMNQKFGRQFVDRVANPDDILQIQVPRKKNLSRSSPSGVVQLEIEDANNTTSQTDVQDLIFNYMGGVAGEALLDVLVEPDFNVAVQEYVHKSDLQAIDKFIKVQLDAVAKAALECGAADVSKVGEVAKKRAETARNACLASAMDTSEERNPAEESTITTPDEEQPASDESEDLPADFSDDDLVTGGKRKRASPAKRAKAKPPVARKNFAAVVPTISESSNPLVAAMASQAPTTATRRQWARRM